MHFHRALQALLYVLRTSQGRKKKDHLCKLPQPQEQVHWKEKKREAMRALTLMRECRLRALSAVLNLAS